MNDQQSKPEIDQPKVPEHELFLRLKGCPMPGELFRHYKSGTVYEVVNAAVSESTQQPMVVYRSLGGCVSFCRPLAEWNEVVEWEGKRVFRFYPVAM